MTGHKINDVPATCSICGVGGQMRRGWCRRHYERWLRHGDPEAGAPSPRQAPPDGTCTLGSCTEPHYARGWCNKHYLRWRHHGDPLAVLPPAGGRPVGAASHAEIKRRSGADHPNWAGEDVGYVGLHGRVRSVRGSAEDHACAQADVTCRGPMHWANISHEYIDTEDFMPLCQSHHFRYDRASGTWGARKK